MKPVITRYLLLAALVAVPSAVGWAPVEAAPRLRSKPVKPAPAAKPTPTCRTPTQSRALIERVVEEAIDTVWTHADYYWHEGRYEDHVAICRFMMRADPSFAEAYSSGGWLLENLGRKDEALAVYLEGVRAVPNDWRPLHDLGYFYFQQKRYPEAIETLEKAVGLQPPAFVWHVLAHSYEKAGDKARSIATWRRCLELHPSDGAAGHNLRRLEEPDATETPPADDQAEAN